jgi:hypothetical protein
MWHDIVMDLLNTLPGNRFVNMNRGNIRRETVFPMQFAWSKSMEI